MNFAGLPRLLPEVGGELDFVLADLGVSSMQLDNPARGFTYKTDGPLDLRLNPNRGKPAAALLRTLTEEDLADLLVENAPGLADEHRAAGAGTKAAGLHDLHLGKTALGEGFLKGCAEGHGAGGDAAGTGAQVDACDIGHGRHIPCR